MGTSQDIRLSALIEAGLAITSELSFDAVLQRIVEAAARVTGARYGALGVLGDDGRISEFVTTGVTPEERAAIGDPPVGKGILGELIRNAKPLRITDIATHERSAGFPPNHPPMHSFLGAPVMARGQVFGNIYLAEKQGASEFTQEDEEALVVLAAQAGVAVENARLFEEATRARTELERLAVMEDRERIARELHDGVIQSLFAVGMGLQGAAEMSGDAEIRTRIAQSVDEIDRVIRDLRNYIFGLRPGIVADRQLDRAIRELTTDFEAKSGVTTVADIDPKVAAELTARAGDVVQLAREALSNVGRHSGAATCRVSLRRENRVAVLEVDDDGSGFVVDAATQGDGLRNMRERVEALGGGAEVTSTPGSGTTVSIRIPL